MKNIENKTESRLKAESYNEQGIIYREAKKYKEAIEFYNKALSKDPNFDKVYYNLGIVYYILEEFDKSIEMYIKALELGFDKDDNLYEQLIKKIQNNDIQDKFRQALNRLNC